MKVTFQEIDSFIEETIVMQYGSWVRDYKCLVKGKGCYLIAAIDMDNGVVAGFASLHPAQWIVPLEQYDDGFIEVIEVAEAYRRQGIGKALVGLLEKYATTYGYYQIRAWSSSDKTEALHMWHRLNYCMCPAAMLGQSVRKEDVHQQIVGYYCAKMLNSNK